MLPRRKNIRLPYYDYHTNGMYFITICTKKKQHVFGKISDGKIVLNPLGQYGNITCLTYGEGGLRGCGG